MIEEKVYLGLANTIELELSRYDVTIGQIVAINHSTITRVKVVTTSATLDSDITPELFDFTASDRLVLKLGASGLSAGVHIARLITYAPDNAIGLGWGDIKLLVYA